MNGFILVHCIYGNKIRGGSGVMPSALWPRLRLSRVPRGLWPPARAGRHCACGRYGSADHDGDRHRDGGRDGGHVVPAVDEGL